MVYNHSKSIKCLSYLAAVVFCASYALRPVYAADPYVTAPSDELAAAGCKLDPGTVKIPDGALSLYYPSDVCGTIFIGPPNEITSELSAKFSSVSQNECDAISELLGGLDQLRSRRAEIAIGIINGEIGADDIAEERAKLRIAADILNEGLEEDYEVFGARVAVTLGQDWLGEVEKYQTANPEDHWNFIPLPTAAAILTYEEVLPIEELEAFGVFSNERKEPFIDYFVSGLSPIPEDSKLMDENILPIFFPRARAVRSSNLKNVEFGGGKLTGAVTLNRAGFCRFSRQENQNPVALLVPTLTWQMALKTFGTYTVTINTDYVRAAFESLVQSSNGTAYASAFADRFFVEKSSATIDVVLDDDLRNSLSAARIQNAEDAFKQSVLMDMANQFLAAATGSRGQPISMPEVANVEQYTTVTRSRQVCRRSGGFFGIGGSTRCWDQAYDVRVLQDTTQRQSALDVVLQTFNGSVDERRVSWILLPWNSGLEDN